jgi:hypothetical protein
MTIDTVNRWLTLAANVGVLVGIAVLILEVNQNTQAMNTASRDETVAHTLSFFEQAMDNQVIARAEFKRSSGMELDGFERAQLTRYQYYNVRIFENIYIQYQRGLFSDEEWVKYRNILRTILESHDVAFEMWNATKGHWADDFQQEVANLLADDSETIRYVP